MNDSRLCNIRTSGFILEQKHINTIYHFLSANETDLINKTYLIMNAKHKHTTAYFRAPMISDLEHRSTPFLLLRRSVALKKEIYLLYSSQSNCSTRSVHVTLCDGLD